MTHLYLCNQGYANQIGLTTLPTKKALINDKYQLDRLIPT